MKYLTYFILLQVCVSYASAVESVSVSGGSFLQELLVEDDYTIVFVASFSTEPTSLLITPPSGENDIQLRYTPLNLSNDMWVGFDFALSAGVFNEDPISLFGDPDEVRAFSSGSRATLFDTVGLSSSSTTMLDFRIPPGPNTLSITPIVPEPATATLIAGLLLICSRGSRRRRGCPANRFRVRACHG